MKILWIIGVLWMATSAWAIPGGRPVGDWCNVTTDRLGVESSECNTGSVCQVSRVLQSYGVYGQCWPDCVYIMQNEKLPIDVFQGMSWQPVAKGGKYQMETACAYDTQDEDALDMIVRCEYGYYGQPIMPPEDSYKTICTACPDGGVTNTLVTGVPIGGYTAASCMLAAGTTATDPTGTFTLVDDCPWVE